MPRPATAVIALVVLVLLAWVTRHAEAGKLSRARDAVRRVETAPAPAAEEAPKRGNLAKVREATRRPAPVEPTRERHVDHGHGRPRRGRHHGHHPARRRDDWGGFFTLSSATHGWCYEPVGPPPVVVVPSCPAPPPTVYVEPPAVEYRPMPAAIERVARQFAIHPYAGNAKGFFVEDGTGKPWLGKLQFELGDAGGDVNRTGIAFLLEGQLGFGIDFDWDSYTEELPGGEHDELHLGQVNLMYRVAETDHALVRAGVGVGWLGDAYGNEAGLNLTVQTDLLLTENWTASADLDFGTLGDADTLHASGTIGRRFGMAEVYAGYDYRRIGEVDLQGPTAGLRLWW